MVDADWPREVVSPKVDGMLRCRGVVGSIQEWCMANFPYQ